MGVGVALTVGLPTDVIPNPWFTRMIPTRTQDYVFLVITALLATVLGATYAYPTSCKLQEGKLAGGGLLSFLTVGCPICNKVVLILLGTSGALRYFEPIQPFLGLASMILLVIAIWIRLRAIGIVESMTVLLARAGTGERT